MEQGRIVFTRFSGDGKEMFNDIYAVDPDGKNESRLTMNPGPDGAYADNAAPRYNRDRSMIAFVSTRKNEKKLYNIFFMDLATRKTAQITSGDMNITSVDWSPDDRRLVFSGNDEEGLQQVHVVSLDGAGLSKLTEGPAEHMHPRWSPRGDLIACVEFEPDNGPSHIRVMDLLGGNYRRLFADDASCSHPSWSPDGSWLICRCDQGTPHLRKINVDTGETVSFEEPRQGADSSPVWSPGGIVLSSSRDWEGAESLANIYRMSERGEALQRLTTAEAFDYCGDW
ncbi:MAG: DPP IV N-terminal domain-containing protein [Nitrospiraceae bacterium]|nr:DPP IV N-terminal domain-containing protein [Nitrospiraceae bacterium]